jgi:hypothetical protein
VCTTPCSFVSLVSFFLLLLVCCFHVLVQVEDAAVAGALRLVEVRSSSGSMGSNLSDVSSHTRYNPDAMVM